MESDDIKIVTERIQEDRNLAKAFAAIVEHGPTFGQIVMDFRYGRLVMLRISTDEKFGWSGGDRH